MTEGLSHKAHLSHHIAESNFLAIENLYGKDCEADCLCDKEDSYTLIKYEQQATEKQMKEYKRI